MSVLGAQNLSSKVAHETGILNKTEKGVWAVGAMLFKGAMVITETKQNHTSFKIQGRRAILVQHCQESGSSNQLLAPKWSSSASKPKLESGRKLQCILKAWQHPLQHSKDFSFFMWLPTRPQDKETIAVSIYRIHCISNYYKEENWYCAGFIVGYFPGHSRKREKRLGKQSSGWGDWDNMPLFWGKQWRQLHLLSPNSRLSYHSSDLPPCQSTDRGRGKMFSLLHSLLSSSSQ